MSEAPTAAAARPAGKKAAAGKTYGGLTRQQWLITGGVFTVVLVVIIWRQRQKAAASSTAQAPVNQGSNECTDANGNPVDCGQLEAGELADLQNSLDTLAQGGGAGGGGQYWTGGTGNGSGTPVDNGSGGTSTTTTPATGSSSSGTTTSSSSSNNWAYPAPTGLKVTKQTSDGVSLAWNAVTGPNGQKPATYTVATYNSAGTEVDQFTPAGTATSEYGRGGGGLPAGSYHTNVWANGGPKAPPHATVSYTLTK